MSVLCTLLPLRVITADGQLQRLWKQVGPIAARMARFEQSALALFESILYASVIPPAAFYQIVVFFDMNPKKPYKFRPWHRSNFREVFRQATVCLCCCFFFPYLASMVQKAVGLESSASLSLSNPSVCFHFFFLKWECCTFHFYFPNPVIFVNNHVT